MDGQWNFRNAYNEARKIRDAQDAFCSKVEAGAWAALESDGSITFPEDLQWESLVDVLRGRVKVSCLTYVPVQALSFNDFTSSRFTVMKLLIWMALFVFPTSSSSLSRHSTTQARLTSFLLCSKRLGCASLIAIFLLLTVHN